MALIPTAGSSPSSTAVNFPRKWLDALAKNVIPEGLADVFKDSFGDPNTLFDEYLKTAKTKTYALADGNKMVYFICEKEKCNFMVTVNSTTEKILRSTFTEFGTFPILEKDMLIFEQKNKDGLSQVEYQEWLGDEWKIVRLKHDMRKEEGDKAFLAVNDPEFAAHMAKVFSPENVAAAAER